MDITSILNDMITSGLGLALVGGAFVLWWLSGRIPNLFSDKEWSWKRGLEDLCKAVLMGLVLIGGTGLLNLGGQFFALIGWDITEATQDVSTYVLAGAMAGGFVYYMSKALKNAWNFFKLKVGELKGNKDQYEAGVAQVGEATRQFIGDVMQFIEQPKESVEKQDEFEEIGGRGTYYNVPINSYDSFRANVLGKGYDLDNAYGFQCWDGTALVWQQIGRNLLTGNGCASGCWNLKRDVNAGNDFQLIWNLKDVKRGDVMVFGAGQYGHIGFADENYNGSGVIRLLGQNQGGTPVGKNGGAGFNVVNMNTASFLGAFRFKKWATNNTAPANPLKDLNTIADEVIAGKWGNGEERREALKLAGYDASEVQSIVNAKLKPTATPPAPAKKTAIKKGDVVVPTKLVDYNGRALRQYDPSYTISDLSGDRAVLTARGAVWAAMNVANLKKA